MISQNRRLVAVLLATILMLLTTGMIMNLLWPPRVSKADATLPPREKATPAPQDDDDDSGDPSGAHIELRVEAAPPGACGVVQWQDNNGDWQDVEGWQGPVQSSSRWWVHPKDFGTGPFRWAVLSGPEGELLGASAPFNLPSRVSEVLVVSVSLN